MNYTLYDITTGEIVGVITSTDPYLINQALTGHNWIEGNYDSKLYYIENGQAVSKTEDPSTLLKPYVYDYTTKSWILDLTATEIKNRNHRNILLMTVDKINPIWYNSLTDEQKQELANYRQALLDVPQQTGFPESIIWPIQPDWI